jgi:hypothetical protein
MLEISPNLESGGLIESRGYDPSCADVKAKQCRCPLASQLEARMKFLGLLPGFSSFRNRWRDFKS